MSDPKELNVKWFEKRRFLKMSSAKNIKKSSWADMTLSDLLKKLKIEVDELQEAIEHPISFPEQIDNIISECLDVANFANMIADNAKRIKGGSW